MLAEHKNTLHKVAIKMIKKAPIIKMHKRCGEPYQEIQVLKEVTSQNLPNVMQLIDS